MVNDLDIRMAFRKVQADMIEVKGEILKLAEAQQELRKMISELKTKSSKKR
jgi:hypothetical protein